ncbi:dicarboxylate/amino acid:cation symporter [Streptococcus rifensis]
MNASNHLNFLKQKKQSFLIRVLVATIIGIVIGLVFKGSTEYLAAIGQIYINSLKAIVVPLLFFSIIHTVTSLEDFKTLRSIGAKSIGILSLHNVLGAVIGILIAMLLGLGVNSNFVISQGTEAAEVPTVLETLVNFFPSNIVEHAGNNTVIPIVIFSVLIGLACLTYKEKETIKPFTNFISAGSQVMFKLVSLITQFTPYAVLALLSQKVGAIDLSEAGAIVLVLISVFLACFFHAFITTPGLLWTFARINPVHFIKKFFSVFMTAFTTQSSVGSLSSNIEAQRKMGVPESIASFSGALSTVFGMPGCAAIWPVTLAVFTVNALGYDVGLTFYLQAILVAWLVSIGTVGVPGIATVVATTFFLAMNLPAEMVIMMTPISAIADMARTAANVQAGGSTGIIVAALEGELDKTAYQSIEEQDLTNAIKAG